MKKNSKVIISAALAALLVAGMMLFPPRSLACGGDGLTAEDGSVTNCEDVPSDAPAEASEKLEKESDEYYFGAATNINSEVEVDHSLFLAGSEVSSKDSVSGIGFLAGNIVEALGSYDYGLFAGNSVKIGGEVYGDLFAAGNAVEIDEGALIDRDVYAVGNTVNLAANLNGNVFVAGNRLVLENITINGNLSADFDQIVVKGKSSISGTFEYNDDATLIGLENLSFKEKKVYSNPSVKFDFGKTILNKFVSIISVLVLTFVSLAVFSKFATKLLKDFAAKDVFKNVLIGLGLLLLVPIAAIFVLISVVGFPVGLVAILAYILLIVFSTPVSGLVLGDVLAKNLFKKEKMNVYLKALLGVVSIELLALIPYLGGLVSLASLLFGMGYLFMNLKPVKK
ncbi:hypothetical protein IJG21_02440 [Candidatus Saccharibacteria bacterium]|nr:hypothetical protein [Candidatus Saccharibacteria bacterium]